VRRVALGLIRALKVHQPAFLVMLDCIRKKQAKLSANRVLLERTLADLDIPSASCVLRVKAP
jgi:hypothetical protein